MTPETETAARNLLVVLASRGFAPQKLPAFVSALADVDLTADPAVIVDAISAVQTAQQDVIPDLPE